MCVQTNSLLPSLVLAEREEEYAKGENTMAEDVVEMKDLQLSMCSIVGLTLKKTLELWGRIGKQHVMILIDWGVS